MNPGLAYLLRASYRGVFRRLGRLREIGRDDLAFTRAEARVLCARDGLRLTDPELGVLMERTEGWAAGLRLAAVVLGSFTGAACRVSRRPAQTRRHPPPATGR